MKLRRKKPKVRIEMMPLMDVVFLLLVFFIYAMMSMAVHNAMPLTLPTSSAALPERQTALSLTVQSDGRLFLDQEPIRLEELSAILKNHRQAAEDPSQLSLRIFAEDILTYQELFRVLDQVKLADMKKVSLQASPEAGRGGL